MTIYNYTNANQLFFVKEDSCSPFLLSINAEGEHIVQLNKEGAKKSVGAIL